MENMMALVARTGRLLQRYDKGCRQVVGCIPYRYRNASQLSSFNGNLIEEEMEVLLISSQNGNGMLFPKGGWEINESMEEAARRETLEEAGVTGNVEDRLGKWRYKSKSRPVVHEGYMFSLLVNKQFDLWPEKNNRNRKWASVSEAREVCKQWWMREALDELVRRQIERN
ncbi:nudix hydrolase 4-like [Rutidosis leptorrhynchoides]|uniref:nudix hydrolase 4-like n=1 Tax=Rutidosis leptorrhynchoides TaxID=125765 RepID=UPI003A98EB96